VHLCEAQQASRGIERQIGKDLTVSANYIYVHTTHLPWAIDRNLLPGAPAVTGAGANGLPTNGLQYGGDALFNPSTGSVRQVVLKYATTTTVTSNLNPSDNGQAVTFTATVSSTGATPTGSVRFMDGTTRLGTVLLSGGVATLTKSTMAVGTHPVTAQYLGDTSSGKSTSRALAQVVR